MAHREPVGDAVPPVPPVRQPVSGAAEEAFVGLARSGPAPLRPECRRLVRQARLDGFAAALAAMQARLADPVFDSVAVHIFRLDEGDDITDEVSWHKANPSGEATQDWEQIRRLAANMRVDENFKYKFRRDVCNLWNDSLNTGGTLPANLVNACVGYSGMPGDVRQLRESFLEQAASYKNEPRYRAWGGADVGGADDFFAFSLVWPEFKFPNQEAKTVVANWYWITSENLDGAARNSV